MRTTESYIKVSNEARAKLARLFKVEEKTVYLALTYRRDSEKMRKIRFTAVHSFGGVAMCHCPECETLHEIRESGRQLMVQNFNNGVKLETQTPHCLLPSPPRLISQLTLPAK